MASISGANKIVLKVGYTEGGAEHEEGQLTAAASPGMNLKRSVTAPVFGRYYWTPGGTDTFGTGTGTTTKASVNVLKEDALQGATVDDAYDSGDGCFVHVCKTGDVIQVLVASGQTVNQGDGLSAISSGKWNQDSTNAAVEALEGTSGALAADTLVRAVVL